MLAGKYEVRKLVKKDITLDYFKLLQQLSIISLHDYNEPYNTIFFNSLHDNHQIYVIEELDNKKIIGSGTIWIEPKLIRNYGKVAHLEDLVIDNEFRGLGLGKVLLEHIVQVAKDKGCYKCVLSCEPSLLTFYEKSGFINYGKHMRIDF